MLLVTRRGLVRRRIAAVIAIVGVFALAGPASAREPVDPTTLNPPPPSIFNPICYKAGFGVECDIRFDDPPVVDEPSGIVCDGVEVLVSQARSVVGKRFYNTSGDLLRRHFLESNGGTFTNPVTGRVAKWVGHDTVSHDLAVPGDLSSGTISVSGVFTRIWLPGGRTIIVDNGSYLRDAGSGDVLREGGQHPFDAYFEDGDAAALQPLCDGLA